MGDSQLYDLLANDPSLNDEYREEEFNRQRGNCVMRALARVAQQHGVPFQLRRLTCNGQHKVLVKAARVILFQEPIVTATDSPSAADYKRELADLHGFVRQLELNLGDQLYRIHDWSGCVLGVLLHGAAGPKFTREQKALGSVMLGVADALYQHWVLRLDLHSIAMLGRGEAGGPEARRAEDSGAIQSDNVVVTRKKKNANKDTA